MIENDVQEPLETYHVYIWREEERATIVESTPPVEQQPRDHHGAILMVVSSFVMALFVIFVPKSPITQQFVLTHSFPLSDLQSHLLPSVTSSQSVTVVASGKGHQDATHARGEIVFYNGSFTQQRIPQSMVFDANGIQIVTDEAVTIPAANPPLFGQASIPAHALLPGIRGNIASYAIDAACCATSVKVINVEAFKGGGDARDYHVVAQRDVEGGAASLRQSLYVQEQKALHAELTANDALIRDTCSSTATSNPHVGAESARVTIHITATCSARLCTI